MEDVQLAYGFKEEIEVPGVELMPFESTMEIRLRVARQHSASHRAQTTDFPPSQREVSGHGSEISPENSVPVDPPS